jgi:hypothetical protein
MPGHLTPQLSCVAQWPVESHVWYVTSPDWGPDTVVVFEQPLKPQHWNVDEDPEHADHADHVLLVHVRVCVPQSLHACDVGPEHVHVMPSPE